LVRGLARLPRAFFASRAILRRFRPDLVIGVGGYASGPLVLAAAMSGYATAIQEQNSRAGLTNRLLGRIVRRVFVAFEEAARSFDGKKTELLGNPVRKRFLQRTSPAAAREPREFSVLVVGGSQGARAVNDLVVDMAAILTPAGTLPRIVHQTGPGDLDRVRQRYAAINIPAERVDVRPYIDDMPAELARAGLVIGRAGALTLAELAIVGRPAILIPLPTAADDHQTTNARELESAGAAIVLPQARATGQALAELVSALARDDARRAHMAAAMAALGKPDAARAIVDRLERMITRAPHEASHVS
jgi:UDP-N-acetylglucosamine--N-acetylmuramyl-(pentapeptide) pyrophosphoryl-undecaprenol N-acetylglucosamine transferase